MRKTIALILLLALVAMAARMHSESRAKMNLMEKVDLAASRNDPAEMKLERSDPMKSYTLLPDGIECGLLHLADGSDVRFWFLSHHLQPGIGITRFDFVDGTKVYLRGCFCCEVEVQGEAASDKRALLAFIEEWDGTQP